MFPVPFSEKVQAGSPGIVADPFAVIGTVVPFSCPDAEPLIVMLPAHNAEKSPASVVAVWLAMRHWKFVHDAALGSSVSDCDVQLPTYDGVEVFDPPLLLIAPDGALGMRTWLLLRSNVHAAASPETAATAISRDMVLFIMVVWFTLGISVVAELPCPRPDRHTSFRSMEFESCRRTSSRCRSARRRTP